MKAKSFVPVLLIVFVLLSGACGATDSNVASSNLSKDAEMFKIDRRIVFYNGITDTYMLTIEGRCSIKADGIDSQLEVTCKTGDDSYKKHFLGLSDNVTYFVEQLESASVDVYHYKVIFKPQVIIPDVELSTSASD